MPERPSPPALDRILSRRAEFRAFLVSRLRSEADADDVLQNGLMKALRSASEVKDEQKLTAWFYQVLRNAIVDHIRSRRSREVRDDAWATERAVPPHEEIKKAACRCIEPLIDELKPREAELVRKVELEDQSVADAAQISGISPNNASVTLHRARKSCANASKHSVASAQAAHAWTAIARRKASCRPSKSDCAAYKSQRSWSF